MEPFFIYLLKSGGILTIFYLIYKLLLQRETFFNSNRTFLILGIILSLVIPFIEFTKIIYVEATQVNDILFLSNNTSEVLAENKINWLTITVLFYLLGVLCFFFRFIIQLLSLYKLISKGTLYKKEGYKYIETNIDTSPFSFFNYIVYNPENHSEKEIKTIIEHEKAHSSQKHSIDIISAHLLTIFQWINPIAWLYKKAIAQNLEYIADDKSIQKIGSVKDYQYLLLKQSSSNCNLSITNTFFNLLIKKRIVMLNKNKSQKQNVWKYGLILPLLIGFIISFNVKTIAQSKKIDIKENEDFKLVNIGFEIDKNSTNEYLEKIIQGINSKNNGVIKFDNIKRNSNGNITNINISFSNKTQNISNNFSDDSGISSIFIGYNDRKNIFIGSDYVYSNMSLNNKAIFEGDPIYIVDGKKINKKEYENLNLTPEKLEGLNVLKGEKATEKYGEEGKNGVIVISTKNPWKVTGGIMPPTDENTPAMELLSKTVPDYKQFNINKSLIFINHEESTINELKKIKAKQLESYSFKNKEEAIKKYGEKAKYGAIEITTKK